MFSSSKKTAKAKPVVKKLTKKPPSKPVPVKHGSKDKPKKEKQQDGKSTLTFGRVNVQNSSDRENEPDPTSNNIKEASYDWIPVKNPKMCEDTNAERSNSFDGLNQLTSSMKSQGTSLDDMSIVSSSVTEKLSLDSQVCFLLIKPHCSGIKGIEKVVVEMLKASGAGILDKGLVTGKSILTNNHVDTHYAALASRSVLTEPKDCIVPAAGQAEFQMTFGTSWATAIDEGAVYNASDAAVSIGVDDAGLGQMWDNIPPKDVIKFGRGFYCGRLETESKDVRYVINGFYLSLRQSYCTVNKLCWFSVKIPQSLSWEQFRTHVVGSSEDPSACAKGSIRKTLSEKHPSKTTRGIEQNFLHVSESPLEALFERLNWIGSRTNLATDHFGAQLLEAGLTVETLEDWRADPDVFFEGSYQSVFNLHEGLDSSACIKRVVAVSASEQKALVLLRRQAEI